MPTLAQRKNGQKNAKRMNAVMAQKQKLVAAQRQPPEIPDCVLKALSVLGLTRNKKLCEKGVNALCALVEEAGAK